MAKNAKSEEHRPWGSFTILSELTNPQNDSDIIVKQLVVNPRSRLSYQTHKLRREHWYVIHGVGQAVIDDFIIPLHSGVAVEIAVGVKHRLINTDDSEPLILIEVITGQFDEHDIERLEDDYQRDSQWTND